MEVVNTFNKELKSILESKLPVSRHKMSLITKSAMKALKFYKHVVQSVEKFIAKCSCDYKVPGLYVIDAIVRQSKHQYCDKDVFVPRFMKNIVTTFLYLSQCDSKDLPSLERVLRLWQQNGVFPTDLVEALLELVYEPTNSDKIIQASTIVTKLVNDWNSQRGKPEEKLETFIPHTDLYNHDNVAVKNEGGLIDSITKLLTRFHAETGQDVSSEINQIQILHKKIVEQSALLAQGQMIDADTLSQLHQSMEELTKKAAKAAAVQQSKLAMLATDDKEHLNEAITDMEFVEQLQQMVDTLGQTRALQEELKQALEMKAKTTTEDVIVEDAAEDSDFRPSVVKMDEEEPPLDDGQFAIGPNNSQLPCDGDGDVDLRLLNNSLPLQNYDNGSNCDGAAQLSNEKLSKSSSNASHKRKRSGSDSRYLKRKRSRSKEMKKKEKRVRDSRKKWMPYLRSQSVGIISKTVFIGHLHKHVSETKLRSLCEEFGTIEEFNMIPPRGCAFVTFEKRKSAHKASVKMHELKFEGRELKVAWAPNKGVKDDKEFRDCWIEQEGCTYIHLEQFPINRITELTEGGAYLDEDSLTEELKQAIRQFEQQKAEAFARGMGASSVEAMISVAAEVANKKIPLLNTAEKPPEISSPFFSHYPAPPPPIMSTMIPYPPPPHIFIPSSLPPPHQIAIPDVSMPLSTGSVLPPIQQPDEQLLSAEQSIWENSNAALDDPTVPTTLSAQTNYSPTLPASHMVPPFLRPGFRNPMIMPSRGRVYRPPMRFSRHPPPGFPAFRPNIISRPPAPRF